MRFSHDGAFLRRLAHAGARFGPRPLLKYSPPAFGVLSALMLPEKRRRVAETLSWVHGEGWESSQREVFTTFMEYARCLAEALASGRPEAKDATCHVQGEAFLRDVLEQGRGVIVGTAHTGPWDAAAARLKQAFSRDVVVVMREEPDAAARALHDRVRAEAGVRVVHVGSHPLDAMPLVRELRRGSIVAFQLDRSPPNSRELEVTLFGRRASLPEGPFRLAALANAPILPLFARRRAFFEYDLVVYRPIELSRDASRAELERAAQAAADAMQSFIRERPTQWFNF
ncbi:MAG TPA: lysophospholipid acyltransferase family protein [Polyangiaceae bacterium]|nr:lysophospholipid acyltransferase family protein [Polyangiaceae bacterium]